MPPRHFIRLLLIEDVDDLQTVLQFSLGTSGWQVITTDSTQGWLTVAQEELPDVILLDGHSNQSAMLAQLKASVLTQDIPVVCLVPRDRLADQRQAQAAGAAAIVAKPFDPTILIEAILDIVEPETRN
ncbi:MAG: response regulator [Leptolyngbya sp. SIO1E4]|nr:response regulator [Leptolyngbya sp. SIO1E4]